MNETACKTSHVVTTELGRINQLTASVATKFMMLEDTTINKKRGVVLPTFKLTTYPRIRYFGIGIRGAACVSTENNIMQPYMPSAANMDLYQPIPFRCVKDYPLSIADAANYRIITETEIDGHKYYQYWLKLLEFQTDTPKLTSIANGREQSWTLDTAYLNPTPTDLLPTDASSSIGNRTSVSVTAVRRVLGSEVTEVINAMYGGDLRKARISEFGLYSGVETTASNPDIGGGSPYAEAGYVQLASHMCTIGHDLSDPNSELIEQCVIENGALITL